MSGREADAPSGVLEIEVKALRAALADAAGAVEARNTIPILSNVSLAVTPTSLMVTGTDLDVWVTRHCSVETGKGFVFTAEAGVLRRIVDRLPADAMCVLQLGDGKLTVKAGRSRFTLPTLPAEDFPGLPSGGWDAEFEMPAVSLAGALDRVRHAISTEETRYYLNGVFVHAVDSELRLATTDGARLARVCLPSPDGAAEIPDIIIPRKVVKLLDPLLDRHQGSIDVRVSRTRVRFEIGETTIDAKLIDGTFPDYQRVIPASHEHRMLIGREELTAAIGRVITVSSDKDRAVKAEVSADMLVLSVSSPEKGQGTEELPCDWSGDPLTIGFNARKLLDALGQLTADQIEARLGGSADPALWRDDETSPAVFVVMPFRV